MRGYVYVVISRATHAGALPIDTHEHNHPRTSKQPTIYNQLTPFIMPVRPRNCRSPGRHYRVHAGGGHGVIHPPCSWDSAQPLVRPVVTRDACAVAWFIGDQTKLIYEVCLYPQPNTGGGSRLVGTRSISAETLIAVRVKVSTNNHPMSNIVIALHAISQYKPYCYSAHVKHKSVLCTGNETDCVQEKNRNNYMKIDRSTV